MIFVVGAQRSGTNWLDRMLTTHPEIVGIRAETHLFSHGIAPLLERFHHGASDSATTGAVYMDPTRLYDSLRQFCDDVFLAQADHLSGPSPRILERTPLHVHHLDLISSLYPDARVVHIIRDGCDVARSLTVQSWGPATLAEAAREWASAIRDARSASVPHYTEVRYEDLLASPVESVAELFEWLGLHAGDEVRAAIAQEAGVAFNVSRGHPGIRAAKWRSELSAEDQAVMVQEAGGLLVELGYGLPEPAGSNANREPAPAAAMPAWPRAARARARAARTALARLLRREQTKPADPSPPDFSLLTSYRYMTSLGVAVDEFLEAIALRRYGRLATLITPDAEIVVCDSRQRQRICGEAGVQALIDALVADQPRRAQMVRDDCIVTGVGATVIQTQAGVDGKHSETTYVLGAAWAEPKVVFKKVVYRRPEAR